jgi:hypothetical protein
LKSIVIMAIKQFLRFFLKTLLFVFRRLFGMGIYLNVNS